MMEGEPEGENGIEREIERKIARWSETFRVGKRKERRQK